MILFLQPLTAKPSRVVIKIKYYMIKLISFFLKKKKGNKSPSFPPNTRQCENILIVSLSPKTKQSLKEN